MNSDIRYDGAFQTPERLMFELFSEEFQRQKEVAKAAPVPFLLSVLLVGGLIGGVVFFAVDYLYERQIQTQAVIIANLESQLSQLRAPVVAIKPTSPQYVVMMSNDQLRAAAISLAIKIRDFARPSILDRNEGDSSIPVETRTKRAIQSADELDEKFRTHYALEAANLTEELAKRTGSRVRFFDELNTSRASVGIIIRISDQLQEMAAKLP